MEQIRHHSIIALDFALSSSVIWRGALLTGCVGIANVLPCLDVVQLQQGWQLRDDVCSILFIVVLASTVEVGWGCWVVHHAKNLQLRKTTLELEQVQHQRNDKQWLHNGALLC